MRRLLAVVCVLLVGAIALAAPPTPTTLTIDCGNGFQTTPFNCNLLSKPRPDFRFTGSGAWNAYQIQVDKVSPFSSTPWFWDSGTQSVSSTTTTTATFPASTNGGSSGNGSDDLPNDGIAAQSPWAGQRRHYWRVRVSDDGGSTWSAYSSAALGAFSVNTYPMMPEPLSVASGSGGSFIESYGDTTAGATLHASTTGSGSACSVGTPCTLTTAVSQAVAGNTIALASGSYSAPSLTSAASGTKAKPITLTVESGATVNITSTFTLSKPFWTINGVNITSGCLIYGAANLIVRNSSYTSGSLCNNGNNIAGIHIGGNPSNYFVDNTINVSTAHGLGDSVVTILPSTDKVIRGVDAQAAGSCFIKKNGTSTTMGGNLIISDSHIHNFAANDGGNMINLYYGTGHVYFARDYIRDGLGSYHMTFIRGAWPQFRNVTIGREGGANLYCMYFDNHDGQTKLENVACISTSIAFNVSSDAWLTQNKTIVNNSIFRRNGGGSAPSVTDSPGFCGSDGTSCFTFTSVQGFSGVVNPAFDSNGRPASGSGITVNAGVSGQAIPTGAAAPIDIGRFEWNASTGTATTVPYGIYDYQSLGTVNATPRISWTFVDGDNTLMGASQSQSAYEVQVDTSTYFNSLGDWKPLCSSGIVTSAAAFWDVPLSCGLANGIKYYFRVRTWDNAAAATTSNAGTWSDYVNAFTVVGGTAYYVAASGGSDSNAGTSTSAPWATAQKAVNTAVAGDTVYFRGGTHAATSFQWTHGSTGSSGTANNPITFRNFPGETAIINTAGTSNTHGGVGVDVHANYITFEGLRFTGAPAEGMYVWGTTGVVIRNNEFYDNSTNGAVDPQNNLQLDSADSSVVTGNRFYFTPSKGYPSSHNVYLVASNTQFTNNIIQDTETQTSGAYGLQIGTTGESDTDLLIAHNTIVRTGSRAGIVIQGSTITNLTIQNNIVRDANYIADSNTGCIRLLSGTTFTNAIIRNNDLFSCGTGGTIRNESASAISTSGNISSDPFFTNYSGGDYHLTSASGAVVNTGTTLGTQILTDKDGDVRPVGSGFDMGMDEFTGAVQVCGNNTRESPEICDGTDLNSQTCVTQGFAGGTLACASDCLSFNTSACTIATPITGTIRGMTRSGSTKR